MKKDQGFVLVLVMMTLLIGTLSLTLPLSTMLKSRKQQRSALKATQAFYNAETGLGLAVLSLAKELETSPVPLNLAYEMGEYDIQITPFSFESYLITSTGYSEEARQQVLGIYRFHRVASAPPPPFTCTAPLEYVCHNANNKTLCKDGASLSAHLKHGDSLGACAGGTPGFVIESLQLGWRQN